MQRSAIAWRDDARGPLRAGGRARAHAALAHDGGARGCRLRCPSRHRVGRNRGLSSQLFPAARTRVWQSDPASSCRPRYALACLLGWALNLALFSLLRTLTPLAIVPAQLLTTAAAPTIAPLDVAGRKKSVTSDCVSRWPRHLVPGMPRPTLRS